MSQQSTFIAKRAFVENSFVPACIVVRDGKIQNIVDSEEKLSDEERINVIRVDDDCLFLPGVVDSHVHVNEPGRTSWEGFFTATRTAAAAGVTCIADMPLNSIPPTTTKENLAVKVEAAKGQTFVDVAFLGGVVAGNGGELRGLVDEGVRGCKCFLLPSGVDEFPPVTFEEAREALVQLRGDIPLMFHAEVDLSCQTTGDPFDYSTFLASRPPAMEEKAIKGVIDICRSTGFPCHIVHLSAASTLPMIREAKASGIPLTVETCPHYLTFAAETIPHRQPRFKCCPPIRSRDNSDALWEALREGLIDLVVSDHSPCPPEMKAEGGGDYLRSWGGIPSLQWTLPVFHTEGILARNFSWERLVECICENPARLLGLSHRKGRVAVGYDADFVVFNPSKVTQVDNNSLVHKNKLSPYEGKELTGVVEKTILRGKTVFDNSKAEPFDGPHGELLLK